VIFFSTFFFFPFFFSFCVLGIGVVFGRPSTYTCWRLFFLFYFWPIHERAWRFLSAYFFSFQRDWNGLV
jgi:hypothetical protein